VLIPASSHLFVDDHTEIRAAHTPQQITRDLNMIIEVQQRHKVQANPTKAQLLVPTIKKTVRKRFKSVSDRIHTTKGCVTIKDTAKLLGVHISENGGMQYEVTCRM
jgi:hypothetical protein